jgi:DNA-binding CsgD family transcriptional regulator
VTVRAIESTLTKVYAKLGVTSRTQLAARLRER